MPPHSIVFVIRRGSVRSCDCLAQSRRDVECGGNASAFRFARQERYVCRFAASSDGERAASAQRCRARRGIQKRRRCPPHPAWCRAQEGSGVEMARSEVFAIRNASVSMARESESGGVAVAREGAPHKRSPALCAGLRVLVRCGRGGGRYKRAFAAIAFAAAIPSSLRRSRAEPGATLVRRAFARHRIAFSRRRSTFATPAREPCGVRRQRLRFSIREIPEASTVTLRSWRAFAFR